ncbi:MAG: glycosyltransferase family 4 protein [Candidatus Omnitrophica bacterium]|nr:glycosyltransferase family 4 protein [Candidatus Omnitrophota bacterium]
MRILILSTHFNCGGITRYCLNLVKGLKDSGHEVFVASSGGNWTTKLDDLDVRQITVPIKTKSIISFKVFLSFLKLARWIQQNRVDLIHANTRVTQLLAMLLSLRFKVPYISSFHGFYRKSFLRRRIPFSGVKTIAVSESVKEHLIKDLKMDQSKITVVYNGIDRSDFSKKNPGNRTKFSLDRQTFVLGVLGRLSREKGQLLAFETFQNLEKKYPQLRLIFSGEGKLKTELAELIGKNNLSEKVKFLDCSADVFLDLCDLLVVPSREEGFGFVILEAFAKEVPVLGYNVGGIKEIIRDKENGFLFYEYSSDDLGRKIEGLIADAPLLNKVVAAYDTALNTFSLPAMAEKTVKVYKQAQLMFNKPGDKS